MQRGQGLCFGHIQFENSYKTTQWRYPKGHWISNSGRGSGRGPASRAPPRRRYSEQEGRMRSPNGVSTGKRRDPGTEPQGTPMFRVQGNEGELAKEAERESPVMQEK